MCGRLLRCKLKATAIGRVAAMCPACWCGTHALMAAGLDEVRYRGPNQWFALRKRLGFAGCPRSRVDRFVITSQHLAHPHLDVECRSAGSRQAAAAALNSSPRASTAQAIRAVLLARATETTRAGLRSSSCFAQALPGLSCRARRSIDVAPITSRRRIEPSPCLLMRPSRSLPPLLCGFGVRPSQAANCRPERNRAGSGTEAEMALAVIGPTPGIVISRRLGASVRHQATISFSVLRTSSVIWLIRWTPKPGSTARGGAGKPGCASWGTPSWRTATG